jgi:hypothetical protein
VLTHAAGTAVQLLPPHLRATVDCAGHALEMYAPGGSFTTGAASHATFHNCYWSNYAPGEAARMVVASKDQGTSTRAPVWTPYRPNDSVPSAALLNSFVEQPCPVRIHPRCRLLLSSMLRASTLHGASHNAGWDEANSTGRIDPTRICQSSRHS